MDFWRFVINFIVYYIVFVVVGFDLQPGKEGGTWLGLSAKEGILKFGALLNLTGEAHSPDLLGECVFFKIVS